jgi:DNA-binding IclR family transcriptional regulator
MNGTNLAVTKALAILDFLGARKSAQRLKDIAQAVDLPTSTAHRLLASLATKDYVQQDPHDQTYRLGWKVAMLARAFDDGIWLIQSARPYLQQLVRQVGRSANLAVLQGDHVVPLECILPEQSGVALYTWPGTAFPPHATALGKILLAGLSPAELEDWLANATLQAYTPSTITDLSQLRQLLAATRACGYVVNHGEFVPEERCVAAPIKDADGATVAAISITARTSELTSELEPAIIAAVTNTARRVSEALFGAASLPQAG